MRLNECTNSVLNKRCFDYRLFLLVKRADLSNALSYSPRSIAQGKLLHILIIMRFRVFQSEGYEKKGAEHVSQLTACTSDKICDQLAVMICVIF